MNSITQISVPRSSSDLESPLIDLERRSSQKKQQPLVLFKNQLPFEKFDLLSTSIIRSRNQAIKALVIQFIAVSFGFLFRRFNPYIFFNLLALIALYIGALGVLKLQESKIAMHAIFSCGVIGIVWFYSLIEAIFMEEAGDTDQPYEQSERFVLILTGLPYLIDFICGLYCTKLTYLLFKSKEQKTNNANPTSLVEMEEYWYPHERYNADSQFCCICMKVEKSCAINPCGHVCLCFECNTQFKARKIRQCPICRRDIQSIITLYK